MGAGGSSSERRVALGNAARFLVAGGLNTLLTLAIYEALLFAMTPAAAYALSWVAGLLFVMVVYPDRVFAGARRDAAARVRLGLSYALIFVIGLGALRAFGAAGVPPRLAIVAVLAVTTASNFLIGQRLLRPRASRA